MTLSPFAGKPAPAELLVDIPRLVTAYYTGQPDAAISTQRVAFGTSGHRGSSFELSFNEWHVLAISQAICLYRKAQGIDGPLFIGMMSDYLEPRYGVMALGYSLNWLAPFMVLAFLLQCARRRTQRRAGVVLERVGIAGRDSARRGVLRIDQSTAPCRVVLAEQTRDGRVDILRIGQVGIAVGECQAAGFDIEMLGPRARRCQRRRAAQPV